MSILHVKPKAKRFLPYQNDHYKLGQFLIVSMCAGPYWGNTLFVSIFPQTLLTL